MYFETLDRMTIKGLKKFHWIDITLLKTSIFFFSLMLAKLWPELLGLNWKWYLLAFVLSAARPMYTIFKK